MRTITFEVEVDDKIFDTMVPSIYDDAVKQAPDGRLFLCKDKTSVAKKLMRIHRDATAEGGKESPWFEAHFLPDDMRIVKITTHNDRPADAIPDGLIDTDGKTEQTGQEDLVNEKLADIVSELKNLLGGVKHLGDLHAQNHATLLDHFKQSHELENWLQEHQNRAEDRLMNHIQECCDKATLTTKQYAEAVGLQLAKITGTAPQPSATDEVTPQALLKAIEIVSGAMLRGDKYIVK